MSVKLVKFALLEARNMSFPTTGDAACSTCDLALASKTQLFLYSFLTLEG